MIETSVEKRPSLLCRQQALRIALPLSHVIEIMRPLPVESVRGMASFVRGMSVIRGAPVPVVDAAALLGVASTPTTPAPSTRWVILRAGARSVALAVESVEGIVELSPDQSAPLPPLLGHASADVVAAIGTLDAELLVLLHGATLLSDADWRALADQGVAS